MSAGTLIDLLLVLLLASYAISGYRQGLVVSVLSVVGFLGGGALGMAVLPKLMSGWSLATQSSLLPRLVLVGLVLVFASIGQSLAVQVGRRLRRGLRARPALRIDAALGAVASLAAVAVLMWFVAGGLRGISSGAVARAVGESRVLRGIDSVVPPATAGLFTGFRQMLDQGGFPRVFDGLAAEPITPVDPPSGSLAASAAVQAATASVVKITGVAAACRQGQEGSGWVISAHRVVTNAHVVAGLGEVTVRVKGVGPGLSGRVVVFDPGRDLAVIDVPSLSAAPLPLGAQVDSGADAVVAGFPLDGPLRLDAARVRQRLVATGQDIYGQPGKTREIYSLYTRVEPGNSGGPLLSPTGAVIGVVFAKSLDDDLTGYALTLNEAAPVLEQAVTASTPVSTGACTVG